MKRHGRKLAILAILAAITAVVLAHPHYTRTATFVFVRGGEPITLQHITYPYNDANPDRIDVGQAWNTGGKLSNPMALKSGDNTIAPGDHGILVVRDAQNSYRLALGSPDSPEAIASEFESGLANQDHLVIDFVPHGDAVYLVFRFGTFRIASPIAPAA